jgi:hypothetical protein
MNKAIKDAIGYAEGQLAEATNAAEAGATAKARLHVENGLTVLRAAYLMNDLNAPAQTAFRNLRKSLEAAVAA